MTAGLVASALTLTGCNKADKDGAGTGGGGGTPPKKEPAVDPPTAPPKVPEKEKEVVAVTPPVIPIPKIEPDGGGRGIEKQVEGYWALDAASIKEMVKAEMGGKAGAGEKANPFAAMTDPIIEMMSGKVVLELVDGKSKTYAPAIPAGGLKVEESSYKITDADASKGTFTVEMTDKEGVLKKGEGTVKGDTMTMALSGVTTKVTRLAKADFDKRLKEIEAFKLDLSKLIPKDLKDLIPEGFEIPPGIIPEGVKIPEGILPEGVKIPEGNKEPKPPKESDKAPKKEAE